MAGLDLDPFATNNYGVVVSPIDWDDQFAPLAKTTHGITLVSNDYIIGRVLTWQPAELQREVQLQYELNYWTYGRPVDVIPGRATGYTVQGTAGELWDGEIEKRLAGEPDLAVFSDLVDQIKAFTIYEHWFKGLNPYRTWVYYGCWLTSRGDEGYNAEGDSKVISSFTIQYVARRAIV